MSKRFIALFVVAALLILFGLVRTFAPTTIDAVQPMRGQAVQAAYATGTVEATVMMPIAPRRASVLQALLVDERAQVQQGQILAQLDDADVRNTVRELEARLVFATQEYQRKRQLQQSSASSKAELQRASAELEALRANLAKAKAEAGYMQLVAPADGMIIRRDGEVGELISANQPVFWLTCCAPLRISAEVDEEDIASVRAGQKVLIRADAFPDQVFDGEVQAITPKGDAVARSYRVRITLTEDHPLMIGMTAETNIILRETPNALLLPATAVNDKAVWVIADGRLAKRSVEVGANGLEQVEIRSGIDEGDIVVRDASQPLEEGVRVRAALTDWAP